jgi:hypothetical protein
MVILRQLLSHTRGRALARESRCSQCVTVRHEPEAILRLLIGVLLAVLGASAQSPGTFTPAGSLNSLRRSHTATLLPNGKVLITGGEATLPGFPVWSSTELYDTSSGTFSPAGDMTASRSGHTATLLPDGKVLIAGGRASFGSGAAGDTAQSTAELYDPLADTFTPAGSMSAPREGHTATLLNNGKVLIAGGVAFKDGKQMDLGSAELYDPATGTFTPTGRMQTARSNVDRHFACVRTGAHEQLLQLPDR